MFSEVLTSEEKQRLEWIMSVPYNGSEMSDYSFLKKKRKEDILIEIGPR